MSERKVFKTGVDEKEKGTYADLRNGGGGFEGEKIVARDGFFP